MIVESVTLHGIQAYPKTSQLEQLSKTVLLQSVSSLSHSFFPWKSFQTKRIWDAHFHLVEPESTLFTGEMSWLYFNNLQLFPRQIIKMQLFGGNYGKCIQIHVRWVIFRWKTRELSWGLFVNMHRSVVWRKLPNCWLNEESQTVMGALGKRMSQTLHHTQLAQEVDQFHQEPAHSLKR